MIVGNLHLCHDLPLIFDVNDELREEILFILINAAEPIVVRHGFDARDTKNFFVISQRNYLDETRAVDDHQAVRAGKFRAAAERALDHRQKRK